ncbi:MAG: TIGR00730 family Rossman fold protein [Armatimonadetes bacterium]|nr:TIGR00730 family Rossman fold protein [Armatimonadota bacterium]
MVTPPDHRIEAIRHRLQAILEEYFSVEAELKELEADRFRVCIFGSARIRPTDQTYQTVYRLARDLGDLGVDIVTGGGPGLMEAANRGVQEAQNQRSVSYGLPIRLPTIRELANRHLDIKSEHKRFSSRLDEFMRLSHAVVVAPGGIGTLLELMYVWQLIQVGMIERRPVVLLGADYWSGLIDWMKAEMLGRRFVSPGDFDWIHLVETPAEALALVRRALEQWLEQYRARPEAREKVEAAEAMVRGIGEKEQTSERQVPLPRMEAASE